MLVYHDVMIKHQAQSKWHENFNWIRLDFIINWEIFYRQNLTLQK